MSCDILRLFYACFLSRPAATTKPSIRTKTVSRTPPDDLMTTPDSKQEGRLDDDLTSALTVSPTKVVGVVTPMINSNVRDSDDGESSRPKKRAKRLFSTMCP